MPRRKNLYDPDEWDDEQWATFDTKVIAACTTLLRARDDLRRKGVYRPSPVGDKLATLAGPQDLDAELSALLEENP